MLSHRAIGRAEAAHNVNAGKTLRLSGRAQLCERASHSDRGSENLTHLTYIDDEEYGFAIDAHVVRIRHVPNPFVHRRGPIRRPNIEGSSVNIEDGVLHAVAIRQRPGDLEGGVKILAGIVYWSVEIPVENEKVDAEVVRRRQLLFDGACRIILPARNRLTILIGAQRQSLEVIGSERA